MPDISHLGTILTIAASNTSGGVPVPILHFPKDTDPVTSDDVTIGNFELGTNGDAIGWAEAMPTQIAVSVIPNTSSHIFMHQLFQQNKAEKGKRPANDVITMNRVLPNGAVLSARKGKIISGPAMLSQQSSGKLKTVTYTFMFGQVSETPPIFGVELL